MGERWRYSFSYFPQAEVDSLKGRKCNIICSKKLTGTQAVDRNHHKLTHLGGGGPGSLTFFGKILIFAFQNHCELEYDLTCSAGANSK